MPRIFWRPDRLRAIARLRRRPAAEIAEVLGERWGEPLTAEGVRCAAERAGIPLLARGGAPTGNGNARRPVTPA